MAALAHAVLQMKVHCKLTIDKFSRVVKSPVVMADILVTVKDIARTTSGNHMQN